MNIFYGRFMYVRRFLHCLIVIAEGYRKTHTSLVTAVDITTRPEFLGVLCMCNERNKNQFSITWSYWLWWYYLSSSLLYLNTLYFNPFITAWAERSHFYIKILFTSCAYTFFIYLPFRFSTPKLSSTYSFMYWKSIIVLFSLVQL